MKTTANWKCLVPVSVLLVFGLQGTGNGQTPTIATSTGSPR